MTLNDPVLIAFGICFLAAMMTVVGSLAVMRAERSNPRVLAIGLGFAAGAMVYVSLVEILGKGLSAFGEVMHEKPAYIMTSILFFAGMAAVMMLDHILPNPHAGLGMRSEKKGDSPQLARVGLFATLAITAHNFPEGMATFFATLDDPAVGMPLAVAIAVHNIPEGISIAVPVYYATGSKSKAVMATAISGLAEPVGALLGYAVLAPFLSPIVYGWVFSMIAGAMVFLALDELLPAAKKYADGHDTTYAMIAGMGVMALSLILFK